MNILNHQCWNVLDAFLCGWVVVSRNLCGQEHLRGWGICCCLYMQGNLSEVVAIEAKWFTLEFAFEVFGRNSV